LSWIPSLKIDPGSQVTGLALVNDATGEVVFAAELTHRGQEIKKRLAQRRASRRSRRQRHTRYRKPRFENRRNEKKGWLAPSLESRVCNVITWVKRLMRVCPLAALSLELVRFDMQQMENPDISGVGYQQGTLQGYEVREYLLEKWNRMCAYCGQRDIPLQVEHICPRAKNGSNRISNLTLACEPCNNKKGTQEIQVFLAKQPEVLKRIMSQAKAPLIDAAAVNVTRWAYRWSGEQAGERSTTVSHADSRKLTGLMLPVWVQAPLNTCLSKGSRHCSSLPMDADADRCA
jgi:5-methylcytosine-specific restriction endonuclease McrA